ncbi:efflux RND transporter periplasmic adaptor subunit [Flavobacterium sp. '19STA2R22 D10 B1']|uniref:efflux RND transporter periplasmic adaptor subunit n=1 Tax=Flavobacterium aerium TaxID=3037261 RepID=UPI00278C33E3|nr:efflux RND transporter periplasmic adaptor subunit [Flavobacterium sp. '19STA2R22 D10 B1']
MKKGVTVAILILLVLVFTGALYYLYQKNQESPIVFETEKPEIKSIVKNTVATGSIVPKDEVLIKPNISGIVEEVYVVAGQNVKAGDLLARIRVVPNVSNLSGAQNQVESARIDLDNQKKLYSRQKSLFDKGVISANEFDTAEVKYKQAVQAYNSALQNSEIVKTGTSRALSNAANTLIKSTVSGMVLDVPIKVGNQVIESNNFNEGTTIASLADVNKMIFKGKLDESEVGKIKLNLPLEITVGAIENKKFDAILDYIAPKGVAENGAVQFEIKGTLNNRDNTFIRAGLSANASVILAKVDNVLAIKEALIQFEEKTQKPFVEVEVGEKKFEKRSVELGVSDGIYVEIKKGVSKDDKIKVWNQLKPVEEKKQ